MRTLAIVNQKGGVAKTTTTLNLGAALALEGKRVLLVDNDPQGSLTKCAGFRNLTEKEPTTYEVIKGDAAIKAAIKTKKAVAAYDLLPTDLRFSGAEIELISVPGRDTLLKEALEPIKKAYDYCLIDCSPSLNILTLMALTAANKVLIPVAAQYMPLDGMAQLMPTLETVKKRLNKKLVVGGVIVTMYDSRRSLDKGIIDAIRAAFPNETFNTVIKNSSKLAESPTYGQDIFEYAPKSPGAEQYRDLAKELLQREE